MLAFRLEVKMGFLPSEHFCNFEIKLLTFQEGSSPHPAWGDHSCHGSEDLPEAKRNDKHAWLSQFLFMLGILCCLQ